MLLRTLLCCNYIGLSTTSQPCSLWMDASLCLHVVELSSEEKPAQNSTELRHRTSSWIRSFGRSRLRRAVMCHQCSHSVRLLGAADAHVARRHIFDVGYTLNPNLSMGLESCAQQSPHRGQARGRQICQRPLERVLKQSPLRFSANDVQNTLLTRGMIEVRSILSMLSTTNRVGLFCRWYLPRRLVGARLRRRMLEHLLSHVCEADTLCISALHRARLAQSLCTPYEVRINTFEHDLCTITLDSEQYSSWLCRTLVVLPVGWSRDSPVRRQ